MAMVKNVRKRDVKDGVRTLVKWCEESLWSELGGRLGCGEDYCKPKCDDGKSKNPECGFGCMFHYILIEVATLHIYLCWIE